jgi:ribosomal protein L37AE/L43A
MVQIHDHIDEKYINTDKWEISCPVCEDEIEAEYTGTEWICRACGYRTDGPEGIVNVTERDYYRWEWERGKEEREFYKEFETPNDREELFDGI